MLVDRFEIFHPVGLAADVGMNGEREDFRPVFAFGVKPVELIDGAAGKICLLYTSQTWGGPRREVRAGDVVWILPHEKHWHGAAAATTMVHIAIHEALDGKHVDWLEKVTDAQYNAA